MEACERPSCLNHKEGLYGFVCMDDCGMKIREFTEWSAADKVIPILTESTDFLGRRRVILFESLAQAKSFCLRNLKPRGWLCGYVKFTEMHYQAVDRLGLDLEILHFPRLIRHPWIDVLEVAEPPSFRLA